MQWDENSHKSLEAVFGAGVDVEDMSMEPLDYFLKEDRRSCQSIDLGSESNPSRWHSEAANLRVQTTCISHRINSLQAPWAPNQATDFIDSFITREQFRA